MRLKNKKTGEVGTPRVDYQELYVDTENGYTYSYKSLQNMCEEWEDMPEKLKEWWYIDIHGPHKVTNNDEYYQQVKAASKEIGNYFETKEEAKKAVEKLKAWKRLKDKGYRVMMNNHVDGMLYLRIWNDATDAPTPIDKAGEIYKDLDLLFGGEE